MKSKIIKSFLTLALFLTTLATPISGLAQENIYNINKPADEVSVYFFWANGCPHCADEKPFLEKLEQKYPEVKIYDFNVTISKESIDLLKGFREKFEIADNKITVPFTVIENEYISGWYNKEMTGKAIEESIQRAIQNGQNGEVKTIPEKIDLPFLGEIEIKNLSLPVLTIIIGALDGFNPCAMWVLLFLISLLLGTKDRKRMWILGSVFIITSAFVYFLFMSAWLNLILFLGFIVWVRIIIGLVAIIGGGYSLKEYFTNKESVCKVTGSKKRQKIFESLKTVTQKQKLWIAIGGIILLAFAVNLVELICSAGLPAVYIQILILTNLPAWQYYAYLILYIFVFMLDDLFVFFVAMKTLQIAGITTKYTRLARLIGGVIMLLIGISLIFKPELLMFG